VAKIRTSAGDNSNVNSAFGEIAKSDTWNRQQLDNWIGDTVAEGDFSSHSARMSAINQVAKKALKTKVVSNPAAATRTARKLLGAELVRGAKEQKGK